MAATVVLDFNLDSSADGRAFWFTETTSTYDVDTNPSGWVVAAANTERKTPDETQR